MDKKSTNTDTTKTTNNTDNHTTTTQTTATTEANQDVAIYQYMQQQDTKDRHNNKTETKDTRLDSKIIQYKPENHNLSRRANNHPHKTNTHQQVINSHLHRLERHQENIGVT